MSSKEMQFAMCAQIIRLHCTRPSVSWQFFKDKVLSRTDREIEQACLNLFALNIELTVENVQKEITKQYRRRLDETLAKGE